MMRYLAAGVLGVALGLGGTMARADDVCDAKEKQTANAAVARAKASEAAGDLKRALQQLTGEARFCSDEGDPMFKRVTLRLGQESEKSGQLAQAFSYFETGMHFNDAKRVGLANLRARPTDRNLASNLLDFMLRNNFADGASEIRTSARSQAQRLLMEEEKSFAIRTPHTELLGEAQDWLRIAGDDVAADVKKRALARGDQFAALDYHYALEQALSYYERADARDKQPQVKAKARQIADKLAGGENWNAAADLYELAGDSRKAEALRANREASAAKAEDSRKKTFEKEQGDLEKELGL